MNKFIHFLWVGLAMLLTYSCQKPIIVSPPLEVLSNKKETVREGTDKEPSLKVLSNKKMVTVTEGTNMAVTLSPDKKTLVLDLQGRLWTMPVKGGEAMPITDPLGDARQPAWSPDGNHICFQGYWEGNWHIYTVAKDGSDLQQLTEGEYDHREPHWSPDGQRILFSADREGTYDLWTVSLNAKEIKQVTNGIANEYAAAWSSDGKRIAYVSDAPDIAGIFVMDFKEEDSLKESPFVKHVYLAKGKIAGLSWRPDGTSIVFNESTFSKSQLWAQWLDMPEPMLLSNQDEVVFPFRVNWLNNSDYIYTSSGKIRQQNMDFNDESTIPFEVTFELERPTYPKKQRNFNDITEQQVKGIVTPTLSPNGKDIAFIALNDLWLRKADGTIRQLTNDSYVEISPTWSPDGKRIGYVSDKFNNATGHWGIWWVDVDSGFTLRKTGIEGNPSNFGLAWSPDGKEIAYSLGIHPRLGQVYSMNVTTGKTRKISSAIPSSVGAPTWSPDGNILAVPTRQPYSSLYREGINRLLFFGKRSNWTQKGLEHWSFGSRRKDGPVWSPDGKYMAAISKGLLWILPVDKMGQPTEEPIQMSEELADAPSWSKDGKTLLYKTLEGLRKVNIATRKTDTIRIDLKWKPSIPTERTVIHVGGLINGLDSTLHRNKDIILEGNRIVAIEDHQPNRSADKTIDASDGYAVPGLIDIHAHQGSWAGETLGKRWLAWGITATRDPATVAVDALNRREATHSGKYLGPRIFFTGSPIDGNRIYYADAFALQSEKQLEMELERAELLDYDMIKTYVRLPDPLQQKVVQKAHQLGVPVSSHELYPAVSYGIDGVEHIAGTSRRGYSPKLTSVLSSYGDVTSLIAESGMSFTPTIGIYVAYNYLLAQDTSLLEDKRLQHFTHPFYLSTAKQGIKAVQQDSLAYAFLFQNAAKMIKDIHDKGGLVVAGTDSPIIPFGFAFHMELLAYQVAGLSPFEVLQTATINGAKVLGTADEMGSLEVGKLADILIVGENPLEGVGALRKVKQVVSNGKVISLDELFKNDWKEIKRD